MHIHVLDIVCISVKTRKRIRLGYVICAVTFATTQVQTKKSSKLSSSSLSSGNRLARPLGSKYREVVRFYRVSKQVP